ncbi:putative cytochrome P450 hydroxylase [[Actinomadura] parvosata subsp. kistnae]|uniref:Cytochrome n=1 Tax=[Actinomadura] parvosata subsp. kistnae TaxID=1909395 RepID=A0A1U9ZXR9_9ACTN|nr:cytochrome P450 [Nonomuraea sp. ATCC 55076]AQZ62709.1 cytochrome [Nonomuraea sp. ATCC 55076]SPL89019.1 putative cytochrome P450 hydroxylase [Actinomadura parvosata subsp. kistnae]
MPATTPTQALTQAGQALADPATYTDEHHLHSALTLLRHHAPVHHVTAPGYNPFWAITRHADILAIERDHTLWLNAPRPVLRTAALDQALHTRRTQGKALATLVHLDHPHHRPLRAIAADWFRPATLRTLDTRLRHLARRHIDTMAEHGPACDFARTVAAPYPLHAILTLLGLPESDFDRMLHLTQQLFGHDDDETGRGTGTPHDHTSVLEDLFAHFHDLTARRRAHPTGDLASRIANARIDGRLLDDNTAASYYILIATAGHDTTSSTIAGGLHALITHPGQLRRLREDPALLPAATEEMIRWVTPVKAFMRTAAADTRVRGVPIRAGESVLLSYPSANRDEDVFDEPFRFDAGRRPNRQLAFGFGAHFCLGAALARMEVTALFAELLPRLAGIELDGEPAWTATTFVGGLKRLPVRYSLT